MKLGDFCDEHGVVFKPVKLLGVTVTLLAEPKLEQRDARFKLVVNNRFTVLDELLTDMLEGALGYPLVLIPGMQFQAGSDTDVADIATFEFEGVEMSTEELLNYFETVSPLSNQAMLYAGSEAWESHLKVRPS